MGSKTVIAICQSGGGFVKNKDGTLSYSGGEAFAIDIDEQTQLDDFKKEVAENFSCGVDAMTIKYFLPGNKRTLITIAKDKDLSRMVNFVGDGNTVDVFIIVEEHRPQNVSNMPASRSSRTTESEAVTPNNDSDAVIEGDKDSQPADIDTTNFRIVNPFPTSSQPANIDRTNLSIVNHSPTSSNTKTPIKAAQQWENAITGVDQRFGSFDEFRQALHKYSIAHGFSYRFKKSDSHRVTVKCKGEGCKWRIYASRLATTQLICIKTMSNEHTCGGHSLKFGNKRTREWIGSIIKERLKNSPKYKPKDIADDVQKELGIKLNYTQAWRVKVIAREQLQGSYKEAYTQLPHLCERIRQTNPGSIVMLITKEDSSFHRLFISFHASITGFKQGCRPLIFLDSASLNFKYQGDLLTAISADGDDGPFPIAFAIVDAETTDNWCWFLEELKTALSLSEPVTVVADFQNGLEELVREVFGNAYHSYCLRYLAEKLNKDLKGELSHDARRLLINDFYAAAYAPKVEDYQQAINNIKAISSEAYDWVIKSEPKHWANAFFEGVRHNLLTSNFGHLISSWVSEVDELPITQLIDVLRVKVEDLMYNRKMESDRWGTRLTPSQEEKLEKEVLKAHSLQVLQAHGSMFEVQGDSSHIVDVGNFGCSCKEWQINGLPCCHAIAVFHCIDRNPYDYCSQYFTVDSYRLTYAESIQPVSNMDVSMDDEGSEITLTVNPPPAKRTPGRPKVKVAEKEDIVKRQLQCSRCKGIGHNKKTCKRS